jgi:hypothetical protein
MLHISLKSLQDIKWRSHLKAMASAMLLLLSESKIYFMVATDSMISISSFGRIGRLAQNIKAGTYIKTDWIHSDVTIILCFL